MMHALASREPLRGHSTASDASADPVDAPSRSSSRAHDGPARLGRLTRRLLPLAAVLLAITAGCAPGATTPESLAATAEPTTQAPTTQPTPSTDPTTPAATPAPTTQAPPKPKAPAKPKAPVKPTASSMPTAPAMPTALPPVTNPTPPDFATGVILLSCPRWSVVDAEGSPRYRFVFHQDGTLSFEMYNLTGQVYVDYPAPGNGSSWSLSGTVATITIAGVEEIHKTTVIKENRIAAFVINSNGSVWAWTGSCG